VFYEVYAFLTDRLLDFTTNSFLSYLLYSAFTVVEYFSFATFFYLIFQKRAAKSAVILLSVVFLISAIYIFRSQTVGRLDSMSISFESLILIIFSVYYLFEITYMDQMTLVYAKREFWIVISILIYLSGVFFFFTQADKLSPKLAAELWTINTFFNFLKNILILSAFLINTRKAEINRV
jgi:hypothetical protein